MNEQLFIAPTVASKNLLEKALDPSVGLWIFAVALLVVYCIAPIAAYLTIAAVPALLQVSSISMICIIAIFLGSRVSLLDGRFKNTATRLQIPLKPFLVGTWVFFALFILITFATAPSIPFISAIQGVDANELSQERGDFFKGREGAGAALLYLSTFLTNTIVPYSIVAMYAARSRWRHHAAALFFLFCISFMQKALFLNLVLPMLAYLAIAGQLKGKTFLALLGASLALLLATTFLSLRGETGLNQEIESGDYLTALYQPSSTVDYFLWRSTAVPVFTAVDTLVVHTEQFGAKPLMGATSTLLSLLLGIERINLERFVFEHQFGGWNETANSNAVFSVDAYVNFGWPGVVCFGLLVGIVFRWFRISNDIGYKSLWPLFAFVLFNATLIGMLLSNGFLYMLAHALFLRVVDNDRKQI